MKCCHDPPCPTKEEVDSAHQDLGARIWQRRLLPQCLVKSWCVRMLGKHTLNSVVPCGMGHSKMEALLGQQFQLPFDSIVSWVTFSSCLPRNPGSPTPARSKAACSCVAGRQVHVCESSGGLAAVSHQLTESFHGTALRRFQGTGVLCGDCSFVLPGKGNIVWGHAWLRKESLTLVQCMISLPLHFLSINHFFLVLSCWPGLNHTILITCFSCPHHSLSFSPFSNTLSSSPAFFRFFLKSLYRFVSHFSPCLGPSLLNPGCPPLWNSHAPPSPLRDGIIHF